MLKAYEDFVEEAKQYQKILLNYKKTGKVFTDPNFHPTAKIHETTVNFDDKTFVWKRVDEYFKAPLFKPELIDPNFIQQGELGDCYFLSALSRIARQPDLVKSLFDVDQPTFALGEEEDSINIKCGAVVIYFHAFGRETPVLIDTLIPFKRGTRSPRFSHPSNLKVSPWFCLVEKAFAKLNGSYAGIVSGQFLSAIYSLFGYFPDSKLVSELKDPKKVLKMSPFDRIMKYQREGSVMDASIHTQYYKNGLTEDALVDVGLVQGHSYLLMKARIEDGKNFLCLRNPWGDHEWLGDWSDTSDLWTEELKEALGMEEADDGIFWMIADDFFYYFTSIDIAKPIPDDYHVRRFSVILKPGPHDGYKAEMKEADVGNRPNFAIQITEPIRPDEKCKVYFIIERRYPNIDSKTNTKVKATPLQVNFLNGHGKKLTPEVYERSGGQIMTSSNDLIGLKREIKNNDDIYTIFINRLQKADYIEGCYVQVICKYDFKLYDIDTPSDLISEIQLGGIFLDNHSVMHPDVALPLVKKKVRGRVVSRFDTEKKSTPKPPKNQRKEVVISQEDLDNAQAKLEKESKAKEKAEEEAKAAMEEVSRLQQMMKEMEDKIANQTKLLQEERAKAQLQDEAAKKKQNELEEQLELEKSLLATNAQNYASKKKDAEKLAQKAKKKKDEAEEASSFNTFLLQSVNPKKSSFRYNSEDENDEKNGKKKVVNAPEMSCPPDLFEVIEVSSDGSSDDDEDDKPHPVPHRRSKNKFGKKSKLSRKGGMMVIPKMKT